MAYFILLTSNFGSFESFGNWELGIYWKLALGSWALNTRSFELLRRLFDLVRELPLVLAKLLRHRLVGDAEDLGGEDAGVGRARFADRDGRDGHARGHLHRRQQRVESLERRRIDRHADHRQRRVRGHHA